MKDPATYIAGCSRSLQKIRGDPSLLQLDLKNSFNSVSQAGVLQLERKLIPSLLPWAQGLLGGRSLLPCRDERLYGKSGVHQGSPFSPLLSALALQEVLGEAHAEAEDAWRVWYLDDGRLEVLEWILHKLAALQPKIDLQPNSTKSEIVSTGSVQPLPNPCTPGQGFKVPLPNTSARTESGIESSAFC